MPTFFLASPTPPSVGLSPDKAHHCPLHRSQPYGSVHEQLRQLFNRRLPPFRDLHGMHLEMRPQLAERLFPSDRLRSHPRLELWTVLFSRRCHRILLVNDSVEF